MGPKKSVSVDPYTIPSAPEVAVLTNSIFAHFSPDWPKRSRNIYNSLISEFCVKGSRWGVLLSLWRGGGGVGGGGGGADRRHADSSDISWGKSLVSCGTVDWNRLYFGHVTSSSSSSAESWKRAEGSVEVSVGWLSPPTVAVVKNKGLPGLAWYASLLC